MKLFTGNSSPIRMAQALFFGNAVIWQVFAVATSIRRGMRGSEQWMATVVIAALMLGNAGAMLLAGIGIGIEKRKKLFYFFGLLVLVVNIILTITDQFGVFDFITLVIDVFLFGLLIVTRSQYLTRK